MFGELSLDNFWEQYLREVSQLGFLLLVLAVRLGELPDEASTPVRYLSSGAKAGHNGVS